MEADFEMVKIILSIAPHLYLLKDNYSNTSYDIARYIGATDICNFLINFP